MKTLLLFFNNKLSIDTVYSCNANFFGFNRFNLLKTILSILLFFTLSLNIVFNIKKDSLIFVVLLFILLTALSKNTQKQSNLFWNIRFYQFIKSNKLYNSEQNHSNRTIINSVDIDYFVDCHNKLHIKVYSNGYNYSKKTQDLDIELMSLIQKKLTDKIIQVEFTEYIFNLEDLIRANMSDIFSMSEINQTDWINLNNYYQWNFYEHPHMLISGSTGSGKTLFLNELILKLSQVESHLFIIDPKKADLFQIGLSFFQKQTKQSTLEIIDILTQIIEKMNERYTQLHQETDFFKIGLTANDKNLKPIFIIFDEVSAAMAEADNKQKKQIMYLLTQIILKGRQAGVFIILSTQRPDTDVISGSLRDQLSIRIAFGNMSVDGYKMMFGKLEKELLPFSSSQKGVGYIQFSNSTQTPQEFHATFWDEQFNFVTSLTNILNK